MTNGCLCKHMSGTGLMACVIGSLDSPPRPEPAYAECSPETAGR